MCATELGPVGAHTWTGQEGAVWMVEQLVRYVANTLNYQL